MENLTYEAVLRNPDLLDTIRRDAHRERAEAVHRLILDALRTPLSRAPRIATRRALEPSTCS
jgi:plasmid stabilization system protein ParE